MGNSTDYSFKYNQQDAVLYNILHFCQCSACFAATASGSSKQAWHVPDAVCTVLELLMMGGETAQNTQSIDNNEEYCITLHLVGCT
jgi:hypothetical protein